MATRGRTPGTNFINNMLAGMQMYHAVQEGDAREEEREEQNAMLAWLETVERGPDGQIPNEKRNFMLQNYGNAGLQRLSLEDRQYTERMTAKETGRKNHIGQLRSDRATLSTIEAHYKKMAELHAPDQLGEFGPGGMEGTGVKAANDYYQQVKPEITRLMGNKFAERRLGFPPDKILEPVYDPEDGAHALQALLGARQKVERNLADLSPRGLMNLTTPQGTTTESGSDLELAALAKARGGTLSRIGNTPVNQSVETMALGKGQFSHAAKFVVDMNNKRRNRAQLTPAEQEYDDLAREFMAKQTFTTDAEGNKVPIQINVPPVYGASGAKPGASKTSGPPGFVTRKPARALTKAERETFEDRRDTLDMLDIMEKTAGDTGRMEGALLSLGKTFGMSERGAAFDVARSRLRLAVQGTLKGIPSDKDQKLIDAIIPNLTDTVQEKRAKFRIIRAAVESAQKGEMDYLRANRVSVSKSLTAGGENKEAAALKKKYNLE